jgi:hypothetical protein
MKKLIILSVFALFCVVISTKIQTDNIAIDASVATFVSNIQEGDQLCIQNLRTNKTVCDKDLVDKLFNAYVQSKSRTGTKKDSQVSDSKNETPSNRKKPYLKIELPNPNSPITPGNTPPHIDRNATQSNPSFQVQSND